MKRELGTELLGVFLIVNVLAFASYMCLNMYDLQKRLETVQRSNSVLSGKVADLEDAQRGYVHASETKQKAIGEFYARQAEMAAVLRKVQHSTMPMDPESILARKPK
jgi:hypothetical protein